MGLSDNGELQVLDEIFNAGVGTFPAGDAYLQLHSGDPGEAGTTNIIDIARVQFATGAAAAGTLSNTGNIDFVTMPAVPAPGVVAWSVWDVADATPLTPAGACFWTGWFSIVGRVFVVQNTTTDVLLMATGHGYVADERCVVEGVEAEVLPTGLTAGTLYYIGTTAAQNVTLSTTAANANPAAITAEGQGMLRKVVGKTTNSGDTFRVATGDLDLFIE
jgi:hypothetical protein